MKELDKTYEEKTNRPEDLTNYAIIDMGSNTMRLCVYRYENEKIIPVISKKEIAGLAGYTKTGLLEPAGISKACETLSDFKHIASRFVPENEIRVFATASLRGITNQEHVLETIRLETGLLPEVLSGEEEARLSFTGALRYSNCRDGIMIDIGGASTELVRFRDGEPTQLVSMPIGCLSLYINNVSKVIPNHDERKQIKKEIRDQFDRHIEQMHVQRIPLMLGVGGTVRAVHKLSGEVFAKPSGDPYVNTEHVREILDMLKENTSQIFLAVYKRIPERTHTIVTGLMILKEAIKRFQCESIYISKYGIRDGFLIDRVIGGHI